jgi:hypothetical protein
VGTFLFFTASAIIPVPESFNSRKRMAAGAKNTALSNLPKKDGFVGSLFISQVVRQDNVRDILTFGFFVIQPCGNGHSSFSPFKKLIEALDEIS